MAAAGQADGFDAEALLEQALRERQWTLPPAWREDVLANLRRIHGMISELDALPPQAGGDAGKPAADLPATPGGSGQGGQP